ncbi:T6SS immunity protein Tli4 family protein [Iodobacter ciconiae]|nr:T6SS immunity protein Tli4 family protein [Iodobacter ciconiae]
MLIASISLLALAANSYAAEQTMFEKTKTYCFGRYLVNVPNEAELKNEGNGYLSSSGIKTLKTTKADINKLITLKEFELTNEKDKKDYILSESQFKNNDQQRMIISSATRYGSTAYGIDTFKYLDQGYAATTSDRSYGAQYIKSVITEFEDYLNQVRYRPQNEIPKEPGFCFENGFVANDGKTQQVEAASLYFVLKNHPYVKIRIESNVYFKQEQSLLERIHASGIIKKIGQKLKYNKEGKRNINGLNGEEALTALPSDDETGIAHIFTWETLGEIGNPLLPSINLEIKTGESGGGQTLPSTLSNQEAMALYEAIVKTIRIRPSN